MKLAKEILIATLGFIALSVLGFSLAGMIVFVAFTALESQWGTWWEAAFAIGFALILALVAWKTWGGVWGWGKSE